jgi:diguanylate cyclase (GGDEF)-like protein
MKTSVLSSRAAGAACYAAGALVMVAYLGATGAFAQRLTIGVTLAVLLAFALAYLSGLRGGGAPVRDGSLSHIDPLTGVPTRDVLFTRLDAALASARRRRHDVAVLYIDFDGLRAVNTNLGHTGGDKVLAEIGRRLNAAVRSDETVARVGGDEFVVLLPNVEKFNEPQEAAARFSKLLAGAFSIDGYQASIVPSIGIARSPYDGLDRQSLLDRADAAMYEQKSAKRSGATSGQLVLDRSPAAP